MAGNLGVREPYSEDRKSLNLRNRIQILFIVRSERCVPLPDAEVWGMIDNPVKVVESPVGEPTI